MKRLGERDLKRQAKLDDLAKAKDVADKKHAKLQGEVTRLQGVEAEQHKTEQHLKGQIGSLAVALKSTLLCFS